jgi:4-carboxymuconolactone decarboxylase
MRLSYKAKGPNVPKKAKHPSKPYPSQVDPRLHARAQRLRRELAGGGYVKNADDDLDPALRPVREILTELVWGKLWLRPTLDRRTRSFMNIALFMALNRPHELALNFGVALKNGLSRDDIAEAILHTAVYCGAPCGVNTIAVARKFFREEDARTSAGKQSARSPRRRR